MRYVVLAAALMLGGCMQHGATPEIQSLHDKQCQDMGIGRGHSAYSQCRFALYQQHEAERRDQEARGRAALGGLADGMASAGRNMASQSVYTPPPYQPQRSYVIPPANRYCQSHVQGGVVNTNCY